MADTLRTSKVVVHPADPIVVDVDGVVVVIAEKGLAKHGRI